MGKSINTINKSPFKKLGEVCTYSKGKKPVVLNETKTKDCSVPYINIKAFEKGIISEYTNGEKCNICNDDDLLMVWDGARCGLIGKAKKGAVGSTLMKILPRENIHKEYLYHFISSKFWTLNTKPKGVGIPHIEPTLLWNFELVVPPLPEQQAIVAKIEELLSQLENGKQQLQTALQQLKVYRQSLLKWAFEGKELSPFENFIDTSQNGLSKRTGTTGEEYKVLRLADITNNVIDNSSPRKIVMDENEIEKYKIKNDDLICIRVNGSKDLVGKLVHVSTQNEKDNWAFCDHFIRFRLNPKKAFSKYFHYYFSTVIVRKYIHDNMVTSAGQNTVSQGTIKNVQVPVCSLKEQQQIVYELESKLTLCDKIEETISQSLLQAETLRQSILKKAFEGKLMKV
jgi:type I restriction enzyme S subunit